MLRNSSPDSFLKNFPELFDALYSIPGDTDKIALEIYDLHQRFTTEVYSVIQNKLSQYSDDLVDGELPDSCLLSMVGRQGHLLEPIETYARKVADICMDAIRTDFQSHKPSSEREVQDAIEGALVAAAERLERESPMLSYAVVQTKPDFSSTSYPLFIEVKFIPKRQTLNRINTEVTSRITIYRD